MRILIAPDKFKNSLTSPEACQAIEAGIKQAIPGAECISFPLADGGDGTSDILIRHTHGKKVNVSVHDPLFRIIETTYGLSADGQTAFIEMANASGLRLLKQNERNVMRTTTLGTGEMIVDALNKGARNIILGIGGSGTNDGGIGAAVALGYEFLDNEGRPVEPVGEALTKIKSIGTANIHPFLKHARFIAICDVDNPLTGTHGAAHVYAPQKGASLSQVNELDNGLKNLATIVKQQLHVEIESVPGAGAGGGLGGGAIVFFNTALKRGVDVVFEITAFEEQVKKADWIITGEGKIDSQTLYGKLITGITALAGKYKKKTIAVAGKSDLSSDDLKKTGLDYVFALTDYVPQEEAMKNAFHVLQEMCSRELAKKLV